MSLVVSVVCCQVEVSDLSSRGVLPTVMCLSVVAKPQACGCRGPLGLSSREKNTLNVILISSTRLRWLLKS